MQSRTDFALRKIIQDNKASLKVRREALAAMESPSGSFLTELVSSPEVHPKLKMDAAHQLTKIQAAKRHHKEVDAILKQETQRLAGIGDPKKTPVPPPAPSPAQVISQPKPRPQNGQEIKPPVESLKTEVPNGSPQLLTAIENPIGQRVTSTVPASAVAPTARPPLKPAPIPSREGEYERRQYHALFASRFGRERGQLNPVQDPALRLTCNPSDLDEIERAYFQARQKIEAGKHFDNDKCGPERNVLRTWINEPSKGMDWIGRLTSEGKIASALWDELESLAKTVKHLPERDEEL
jgi:hypothetical protein